jgi:transposase
MSTWAQPGRLRRPGRGLKTEKKSANSQFSKPPHTQKSGHPPRAMSTTRNGCNACMHAACCAPASARHARSLRCVLTCESGIGTWSTRRRTSSTCKKALTHMNLQLHHVVSDVTGVTGMKIIRAIVAGERDPDVLASMRDVRCRESVQTIRAALVGNYQPEHIFALAQALALYDSYQARINDCDVQIEQTLELLIVDKAQPQEPLRAPRSRTKQTNSLNFDVRPLLHQLTGIDLTQIHGIGPSVALELVAECGTDLSRWPTERHFTSWLTLSPGCKISGGKVLSSHTRKSNNRIAARLRLVATSVGRTDTALGAFYRRLAARIGKAKALTATARKIAILFYRAMRFGMRYQDPGADQYERRYRERVVKQLHRRAAHFGFSLQPVEPSVS